MTVQTQPVAEMNRQNVEGIYPLLPTQEAFLWTQDRVGELSGRLRVTCQLTGSLDPSVFEKAWCATVRRHELLRASIHQRQGKSPMLVVWRKLNAPVQFHDWTDKSNHQQRSDLSQFDEPIGKPPLPLDEAPVFRMHLIKCAPTVHQLCWTIHHALLDGWSTSLVLTDLLRAYGEIVGESEIRPAASIRYADYLAWRKQTQSSHTAKKFWGEKLTGFAGNPRRLSPRTPSSDDHTRRSVEAVLPRDTATRLNSFASDEQLTASAIASGIWALALADIYDQRDVAFGIVVSGRTAPLEGIHELVGLLANLVPLRIRIQGEESIGDWLRTIRDEQIALPPHDQTPLADILSWCRIDRSRSLIESLLVVENYPVPDQRGGLQLQQLQSGITSGFPMTLSVLPNKDWLIRCDYDPAAIADSQANAILQRIVQSLTDLSEGCARSVDDFRNQLPPLARVPESRATSNAATASRIVEPRNDHEIQLTAIWEQVLGTHSIGIRDNFFELGGKSVNAAQLMSKVEELFGKRYSPAVLMENPTIEQFARAIKTDDEKSPSMIRFNRRTDKDPIVCVQVGPEYALYYRFLATYLVDNPVVGLQLRALQGGRPRSTVPDMARDYLAELEKAFGKRRLHLVGYCMGAAVALEMARQWEQMGGECGSLIVVDSAVQYRRSAGLSEVQTRHGRFKGSCYYYAREFRRGILRTIWHLVNLPLRVSRKAEDRQAYVRDRVKQACRRAYFGNTPQPCAAPIQLVRSSEFAARSEKDCHLKWQELTSGTFSVEVVDSAHQEILHEPAVHEVAKVIARTISEHREKMPEERCSALTL